MRFICANFLVFFALPISLISVASKCRQMLELQTNDQAHDAPEIHTPSYSREDGMRAQAIRVYGLGFEGLGLWVIRIYGQVLSKHSGLARMCLAPNYFFVFNLYKALRANYTIHSEYHGLNMVKIY